MSESEKNSNVIHAITKMEEALRALDANQRKIAIDFLVKLFGVELNKPGKDSDSSAPEDSILRKPPGESKGTGSSESVDIRTLKEKKQPKSAIEMAVLVAFYLDNTAPESERKNTLSGDDINKYFKQADFKLPKDPLDALNNAKKAGYLEGVNKGEFKLNAVGYNLVAQQLPRGERASTQSKPKKNKKVATKKRVSRGKKKR